MWRKVWIHLQTLFFFIWIDRIQCLNAYCVLYPPHSRNREIARICRWLISVWGAINGTYVTGSREKGTVNSFWTDPGRISGELTVGWCFPEHIRMSGTRLGFSRKSFCKEQEGKKLGDVCEERPPSGLIMVSLHPLLGSANYILASRLLYFLFPWRRISVAGSGWIWNPVRNIIFIHKVSWIKWSRGSCLFALENEEFPPPEASTRLSLPQAKRGKERLWWLMSWPSRRWSMNRHFLVFVMFLFKIFDAGD